MRFKLFGGCAPPRQVIVPETDIAPKYFIDQPSVWSVAIEDGINRGIEYLGSFGPVHVYIADKSSGAGEKAWARCIPCNADSDSDSDSEDDEGYMGMVLSGKENAFGSGWEDDDSSGGGCGKGDRCGHMNLMLYNQSTHPTPVVAKTIALHEYTHVYQAHFTPTCQWLIEGGATYLQHYYNDEFNGAFVHEMRRAMEAVRDCCGIRLGNKEEDAKEGSSKQKLTLSDYQMSSFNDDDLPVPPGLLLPWWKRGMFASGAVSAAKEQYHRSLGASRWATCYCGGCWAVALLIYLSDKDTRHFWSHFWPLTEAKGWKVAVGEYSRLGNLEAFYRHYENLLRSSNPERILEEVIQVETSVAQTQQCQQQRGEWTAKQSAELQLQVQVQMQVQVTAEQNTTLTGGLEAGNGAMLSTLEGVPAEVASNGVLLVVTSRDGNYRGFVNTDGTCTDNTGTCMGYINIASGQVGDKNEEYLGCVLDTAAGNYIEIHRTSVSASASQDQEEALTWTFDLGTCCLKDAGGVTVAEVAKSGAVIGHAGSFLGEFEVGAGGGGSSVYGHSRTIALYLSLLDPLMLKE